MVQLQSFTFMGNFVKRSCHEGMKKDVPVKILLVHGSRVVQELCLSFHLLTLVFIGIPVS